MEMGKAQKKNRIPRKRYEKGRHVGYIELIFRMISLYHTTVLRILHVFFLQMDTGKAKADEESSSEEDSSEEEKPSKTKKQKAKGVNYTCTCTLNGIVFDLLLFRVTAMCAGM
jgi:hypothetical protein